MRVRKRLVRRLGPLLLLLLPLILFPPLQVRLRLGADVTLRRLPMLVPLPQLGRRLSVILGLITEPRNTRRQLCMRYLGSHSSEISLSSLRSLRCRTGRRLGNSLSRD